MPPTSSQVGHSENRDCDTKMVRCRSGWDGATVSAGAGLERKGVDCVCGGNTNRNEESLRKFTPFGGILEAMGGDERSFDSTRIEPIHAIVAGRLKDVWRRAILPLVSFFFFFRAPICPSLVTISYHHTIAPPAARTRRKPSLRRLTFRPS